MAIEIDVDSVLRSRAPGVRRLMPRWLVRKLERLVCQDEMNALLRDGDGLEGSDFCRSVLQHLDVKVDVVNAERLPSATDKRVVFISNHPLGGLDGIALIDMVSRRYGVEPLFIVNDLLMAIEPLRSVFVPINKHGAQSRAAVKAVDDAFSSDRPVIVFPAGLCSRRGKKGKIADLEWQKMFVQKSIKSGRTIIPLFFNGENSSFFYKFAQWRQRLGLKFNIEMVLLPREVFKARGKRFEIRIGNALTAQQTAALGATPREQTEKLRNRVYDMSTKNATTDN
ncbi:MAG: 1-acyl-sn-glycerol-3-phosphate acyltransferase [Muribaculaceae bacterium]|nr:1-acyl-sn-glycerol-3-phosphate acyltransferase [Muribaculaceae bacterium]